MKLNVTLNYLDSDLDFRSTDDFVMKFLGNKIRSLDEIKAEFKSRKRNDIELPYCIFRLCKEGYIRLVNRAKLTYERLDLGRKL